MACPVSQTVVTSSAAAACTTASTGTLEAITGPSTETCNGDETVACQNLYEPSNDSRCFKGRNIAGFVSGDDVTKAETLWALKCVMSHYSYNSCADMKDVLKMMFPDSSIANKISIGSTKMSYYITYGLGPFYHNDLLKAVNGCSEIVVCFDEAVNRISQRGQMDIVVRYWNLNDHIVSTHYFGSAFMGHATSDDLLASFRSALPLSSLLQVSMDGPTVNWKFLDLLEKCMEAEHILSKLINMGSCGSMLCMGHFKVATKPVDGQLMHISEQCSEHSRTVQHAGQTSVP